MALAVGTRLGSYEVVGALGAGGMGEVYRAVDTRLERQVAIKILPETVRADPERVARFEREAKILASLNHPNIAGIHGLERANDEQFIVMELVEGETLAEVIARRGTAEAESLRSRPRDSEAAPARGGGAPRGLDIKDALGIAKQIADALEAAHEAGVIHRDLKPANVKVRPDGTVKVLDFGLAKALGADPLASSAMLTNSPTIASPVAVTGVGVLLGTAAYMSPEQARGKSVDKRADIWAFGCVLYEMLVGHPPFQGDSISDIVVSVMTKTPDWPALPNETPANVRRLLARCLEKDSRRRLRDIGEARFEVENVDTGGSLESQIGTVRPRRSAAWTMASVLFCGLAVALAVLYFREPPLDRPMVRLHLLPPQKTTFGTIVVSPDGQRVAFTAVDASGLGRLWVRRLDSLEAQPLTGTNGASYPFWSPDGRFIGFFADGRLKRIDATGTSLQTICDLPTNLGGARGGTWSRDGVILFAVEPFGPEPIYRVSAGGGEPTPVATLEASSELQHHHWPSFLPDGRRFLYSVVSSIGTAKERTGIYLASLDAAGARMLIGVASNAVYVPGSASEQRGYILFAREQNLMAAPFDASRSEITGAEMVVAGGVGLEPAYGATFGDFSVSETGVLVYGSGGGDSQLRWFDRTGKVLGSLGAPTRDMDFRISPDGSQIVAQREDRHGGTNLWLLDTTRGTPVRFTAGPSYNAAPVWSHDGGHITFFSVREGRWQLWDKEASGRSDERPVLKSNNKDLVAHDWSPDGRNLLYNDIDPITRRGDLWILPTGTTEPTPLPFTRTEFNENFGRFSPDGRWITYVSDESGRNEVYVQSFRPSDGRIGKVRISTDGGIEPRWPRKGNEIFYIGPDNMLIAVEVKTGDTLGVGASRALFPTRPVGVLRYDVSPDGRRFLVAVPMEEMVSSPATVVLDWQEELKELVPTR